jgi:hypothetical protein
MTREIKILQFLGVSPMETMGLYMTRRMVITRNQRREQSEKPDIHSGMEIFYLKRV